MVYAIGHLFITKLLSGLHNPTPSPTHPLYNTTGYKRLVLTLFHVAIPLLSGGYQHSLNLLASLKKVQKWIYHNPETSRGSCNTMDGAGKADSADGVVQHEGA